MARLASGPAGCDSVEDSARPRSHVLCNSRDVVLRAARTDRLELFVSGGWVLVSPGIASALSPLFFDLERRVLNRYPPRELPVTLQSRAYTWSRARRFRRLYAQTRQERPRGLLEDWRVSPGWPPRAAVGGAATDRGGPGADVACPVSRAA